MHELFSMMFITLTLFKKPLLKRMFGARTYNVEIGEDVSFCVLLVDLLNIRPDHHQ